MSLSTNALKYSDVTLIILEMHYELSLVFTNVEDEQSWLDKTISLLE